MSVYDIKREVIFNKLRGSDKDQGLPYSNLTNFIYIYKK